MAFTFANLKSEVATIGVRSSALTSYIGGFVNRAQRQITERRNFTWMHSRQSVTIAAGATSANLSSRFKELSAEKSPVTYTDPINNINIVPVRVMSRAELERAGYFLNAPFFTNTTSYLPLWAVFLEQNDNGSWTLNTPTPFPNSTAITYSVSCYLFPADLSADADTNALTAGGDVTDALINLAKAIAYQSEDPQSAYGTACLQLYEQHCAKASTNDTRRRIAGRSIRM